MFDKINITKIILDHIATLKNYRSSKYSPANIFLFFVLPFVVSSILIWLEIRLDQNLMGLLINVFTIFAGLLFNLLVLLFDVISKASKSGNSSEYIETRIDLLQQTYSNISFEIALSLLSVVLLALSALFNNNKIVNAIFSFLVFSFLTLFVLTTLMILKRIYTLLVEEIQEQRRQIQARTNRNK